jgi:hypothetical protein
VQDVRRNENEEIDRTDPDGRLPRVFLNGLPQKRTRETDYTARNHD